MSDEEDNKKKGDGGAPMWIVTFADLMSLLLTFFILLLSFSEMEVTKFKKIAGSLKDAFGVQKTTIEDAFPKGTSAFYQHYSPGQPDVLTMDNSQPVNIRDPQIEKMKKEQEEREKKAFNDNVEQLKTALKEELKKGEVEIETDGKNIIVRVPEKASFPSGSAAISKKFAKTITKIAQSVSRINGTVTVDGHTDNIPINTSRFRSNWDLSSARAASMATAIMKIGEVEKKRVIVRGRADTMPISTNSTPEGRAKNRRVEVIIGTDQIAQTPQ